MPRRLRIGWPRQYSAVMGIGGYSVTGQSVTLTYAPAADTTPNQFTFTDQTGVALSTAITSAAVTISGLSVGTSITLNASGGTIDKNGDANFLGSQIVANGDTVRARVTSSASNSAPTNCTVVASPSGIQDVFTATTLASSGDPLVPRAPQVGDVFVDLDATSAGTGTQASPYRKSQLTLGIYQGLSAGQQLVFMNASGTGTYTPIDLTGLPSGNSSNRIVVRTFPGHAQANFVFPTLGACLIGSYWDLYNLKFTVTETGWMFGNCGNAFYGADTRSGTTTNVRVIDCTGTKTWGSTTTDNSAIVGAAHQASGNVCSAIDVLRCNFVGVGTLGVTNRGLIFIDYLLVCSVQGCYLQHVDIPIYFKHAAHTTSAGVSIVVKNNIFVDAGRALEVSTNFAQFTNNAFQGVKLGLDEDGGSPVSTSNNCTLSHNTFLDSAWLMPDINKVCANNVSTDNVMIGATTIYNDTPFAGTDNNNSIDYSACDTSTHYKRASNNYTQSAYRTAFGDEAHGVTGTVALVGGTTPSSTPANWALTSGSVGRGNASDGGDRGVNAANLLTVN